jgi:hypothetical protein
VASDGAIFVAATATNGFDGTLATGTRDLYVAKYDAAGSRLWVRQIASPGYETVNRIKVKTSGSVVVVGSTTGTWNGRTPAGGSEVLVVEYSAAGDLTYSSSIGGDGADSAYSVAFGLDGLFYFAGSTSSDWPGYPSGEGSDGFLMKFDPIVNLMR